MDSNVIEAEPLVIASAIPDGIGYYNVIDLVVLFEHLAEILKQARAAAPGTSQFGIGYIRTVSVPAWKENR
ncbi:MAG: hypothetical protein ACHQNE_00380 [Candidatus Kapaibacterium sp.]